LWKYLPETIIDLLKNKMVFWCCKKVFWSPAAPPA